MSKGQPWFGIRWRDAVRDCGPQEWGPTLAAILYVLSAAMDNETGNATVSHEDLARGAKCERETVSRQLTRGYADLGLGRWLARQRRTSRKGYKYYVYRGIIPPEVEAVLRERESRGPREDQSEPRDYHYESHVTESHTNYLFNYLELCARDARGPNGPFFSQSEGVEARAELVAGLTNNGWFHARFLSGSDTDEEAVDNLTEAHVRELVTSKVLFRYPVQEDSAA